jgi:3'(2'), 5'-bisphosphate nucleotidase
MLEDLPRLLAQAVRIVDAAGREILDVYHGPSISARMKEDASPLTSADLAAEKTIRASLEALSDIPVISEETEPLSFEERSARSLCWLVDPLDGTKEFITRNGEFTVNIALVRDGRPILGVVGAPALGTVYWAAEGIGAFVRRASEDPVRISVRGADVPTVVVSRSHGGAALEGFLERLGPHRLTPMGSSLKFCLAAQGAVQLYPRLGRTREWDTAAGHCIVVQAGGSVSDFQGKELLYNKRDLVNPWFFAAATAHDHALATAHAGKAWEHV